MYDYLDHFSSEGIFLSLVRDKGAGLLGGYYVTIIWNGFWCDGVVGTFTEEVEFILGQLAAGYIFNPFLFDGVDFLGCI